MSNIELSSQVKKSEIFDKEKGRIAIYSIGSVKICCRLTASE